MFEVHEGIAREEVRMDIGNQIRERRQRLGLSQEELSTLSMLLSKVEENALNEWAIRKEVTDL